jgi:hypothetical protein
VTGVVLDAGAFIATQRRDARLAGALAAARALALPIRTSAVAVAQVWRGGPSAALIARALEGAEVVALDDDSGRSVGLLLGRARTSDVADAAVALLVHEGDTVFTSDPEDLRHLLDVAGTPARLVSC